MDLDAVVVTDIVEVMKVYSPKGRRVQIHKRASYGLSLCIDGQIIYTQNGVNYVSDKLHAIILPEGQNYSLLGTASGSFPVINFSTLAPLTDTLTVLETRNVDFLIKRYEEIQKLYSVGGNRTKMLSLFYEMLDELSHRENASIIEPAIKFILDNYHVSNITNADLANICNISEVYFRRLFRTHFNTSPKQYILSLRLQKAKQLLSEGKQKICSIANDCGFESNAHFCRIFKEQMGITPREYREKNQIYGI